MLIFLLLRSSATEDDYGFSTGARAKTPMHKPHQPHVSQQQQQLQQSKINHQRQQQQQQRQHQPNGFAAHHHQDQNGGRLGSGNHQLHHHQHNGHGLEGDHSQSENSKWYLKDSMRPVGASVHGGDCKCYRCQRKLTAI